MFVSILLEICLFDTTIFVLLFFFNFVQNKKYSPHNAAVHVAIAAMPIIAATPTATATSIQNSSYECYATCSDAKNHEPSCCMQTSFLHKTRLGCRNEMQIGVHLGTQVLQALAGYCAKTMVTGLQGSLVIWALLIICVWNCQPSRMGFAWLG